MLLRRFYCIQLMYVNISNGRRLTPEIPRPYSIMVLNVPYFIMVQTEFVKRKRFQKKISRFPTNVVA